MPPDDVALALAGVVLLIAVVLDALRTTLAVGEGGGVGTQWLTGTAWRLLLRVHRLDTRARSLTAAGAALLVGTVLVWVAGLWAAWTLILLAGDSGIVNASTRAPATVADVVYYAGFTVFTLGVGDFVASDSLTRLLTAVASFSGLFLVTLSITYLVSVVSAVVTHRALAVRIRALGGSAGEVAACGWEGQRFSAAYVQQLVSLAADLAVSAEQHLAYPVLGYFRSRSRELSAPLAVAQLDDALLLLEAAVQPHARPAPAVTGPARAAVGRYLDTVQATSAAPPADGPPPPPDPAPLVRAGVPLCGQADLLRRVEEDRERRTRLARLVAGSGWSW